MTVRLSQKLTQVWNSGSDKSAITQRTEKLYQFMSVKISKIKEISSKSKMFVLFTGLTDVRFHKSVGICFTSYAFNTLMTAYPEELE